MKTDTSKTKWNLSLLFKSDDDPAIETKRNEVKEESYKFINKWSKRSDFLELEHILREALDEYEALAGKYGMAGHESLYLFLRKSTDQNNPEIKARVSRLDDFEVKILNDIQFFEMRISKVSSEIQKKFLEYSGLKQYKHFLENLFNKSKYLLSEDQEKVVNLKDKSAISNWVQMLSGFLAKEEREVLNKNGKKETKSFSSIYNLLNDTNKSIRDAAAKAVNEIIFKHVDVAEYELNSIMEYLKVEDELRNRSRPDLGRLVSDNMEPEIIDALIEAVTSRSDISKRYYKLKAKLFGVKKLQYHERNVPYGDIDKEISYKKTVDLIWNTFNNLDPEFSLIFKNFVENGQIDVFPKKGKKSGAFCVSMPQDTPVYILLNFSNKLSDSLTLAHEMGHAINDTLVRKSQHALYRDVYTSTAEVASTFCEDFVLEKFSQNADKETQLALKMMKLNDDVSTIQRQIACYTFEQELHKTYREKGYLAKEQMGEIFRKHMKFYMGNYVEFSKESDNWWVVWPHIRKYFYVYSYASGLLISKYMQNTVRKDKDFMKKVKGFLSVGISDSPKNTFLKMGIDISKKEFWNTGLNEMEQLLNAAESLAKQLDK
ncbi:hypothetical protein A3F07_01270 [candidate division WWE3 bacterium RIFCSPHIGHO2_12_FULL_38_15]|uniref:Oligoendopeptidase F n=1 Tax=candidate division WWE3 bacterium RIFCSPHIGHO2_02_FULL_38_14 TaxID=1802620 RepID=A0A1F4VAN9_UNCKA|nr:MAG: hypothetical protein A2793_02025 [candidate division WWE3 bacterium RIFCSPHIGHO2_01_FULL_38_45]OGC48338.1 MAG: hypothetical protein A3F07_01270 [candidate division WWE3 bacterium RIFCSPHIGHO2_12_FULL_38_15]OGC53723.1 MAG: hypothetical protein A3D91_03755 [candidate division WWE3 bacterium RIFCSPHIGHO2_02_FULL_38_14]OGC54273.1 MAG: hypothetical protein A3B64_02070 [candidate division WWE3 bacterium RIFCSPLOWO2_01_FULL_37_24]HLB51516.1 M3 family oligoendopeptidase [Patescibacteria group b